MKKLKECCLLLGLSETDILRMGIDEVYQKAHYRVAPIGGSYYPWQFDNEVGNGQDGKADKAII